MRDSRYAVIAIVLAVFALRDGRVSAQPATAERRLKAAVVSKLPRFVEWPAAAFDNRPTVTICVAPPDPFGSDLADLVAGDTVAGKPVSVVHVAREADVDACHLLYLPARGPQNDPLLRRAATLPVLTVGDDPRLLDDGGIVQLRIVDGRVRFDISTAAADKVGIRMSSQLLRLALAVRRNGT